jgi:hypothetical protein
MGGKSMERRMDIDVGNKARGSKRDERIAILAPNPW